MEDQDQDTRPDDNGTADAAENEKKIDESTEAAEDEDSGPSEDQDEGEDKN